MIVSVVSVCDSNVGGLSLWPELVVLVVLRKLVAGGVFSVTGDSIEVIPSDAGEGAVDLKACVTRDPADAVSPVVGCFAKADCVLVIGAEVLFTFIRDTVSTVLRGVVDTD